MDNRYRIAPPVIPREDISGPTGARLLRLMRIQVERDAAWLKGLLRDVDPQTGAFPIPPLGESTWPSHTLNHVCGCAYMLAALALFDPSEEPIPGLDGRGPAECALALIRSGTASHPISGSALAREDLWWLEGNRRIHALRLEHSLGMGAWLLWNRLDPETQRLLARMLEYDADLFNDLAAPTQCHDDTQAETNAWTAGGLALACCMLKQHPHRETWRQRALEWMLNSFCTEADCLSERIVDGRPLQEWLHGSNTFPDYTVENHGIIHPIYIAAYSEKVRSAVCYALAGEPVPEAVAFNADRTLDTLLRLNQPDGDHLYPQGCDYGISRRLDSFLQACNVIPLRPDPLREAAFLRSLSSLEAMAKRRPGLRLASEHEFPFDLGIVWGLTENYMMRRLFGSPAEAFGEREANEALAGVHFSEGGRFILHRTPDTLSSFSWHAALDPPGCMGLTFGLDRDVLCSPLLPGSCLGALVGAGEGASPMRLVWQQVRPCRDGFGVMLGLDLCGGKVRQHSAFVSLPNSWSVYLEERAALQPVTLESAQSGRIAIYDDTRWPFQDAPRAFYGEEGRLDPESAMLHPGGWLNIDDRQGYAALGSRGVRIERFPSQYATRILSFPTAPSQTTAYAAGDRIGAFALVTCPHHSRERTEALSRILSERGWALDEAGALAVIAGGWRVHAVFDARHRMLRSGGPVVEMPPFSVGYTATGEKLP